MAEPLCERLILCFRTLGLFVLGRDRPAVAARCCQLGKTHCPQRQRPTVGTESPFASPRLTDSSQLSWQFCNAPLGSLARLLGRLVGSGTAATLFLDHPCCFFGCPACSLGRDQLAVPFRVPFVVVLGFQISHSKPFAFHPLRPAQTLAVRFRVPSGAQDR